MNHMLILQECKLIHAWLHK